MRARVWPVTLALAAASLPLGSISAPADELRELIGRSRSLAASAPASAESLLMAGLAQRPDREEAQLRIELGDLAQRANRTEAAAKQFREARTLDPMLETPIRRLIDLGLDGLPGSFRALSDDLQSAGEQHPGVAIRGYRDLMRALAAIRAKGPSDEASRRAASGVNPTLVAIVDLLASSTGRLDIDAIGVDSAAVPGPYSELRDALSIAGAAPSNGFWMSSAANRNVLARAKLAQGRREVAMGRADLARSHFEAGLRIAPSYDAYVHGALASSRLVRLDLCSELLGLLANQPSSGPGSPRFDTLIDEIFQTKGLAYAAKDYEAIQRHHEALGFIYAARDVWVSTAYARNATFQLQHALAAAERRRDEVGYQPQPWVRAALARGLDRSGPTKEGSEMHLAAAQAYLDLDQLDTGRAELGHAARYWKANAIRPPAAWNALYRVLTDRETVERFSQSRASIDSFYDDMASRWSDPRNVQLPKEFVDRQQFKILSDLAAIEVPAHRRQNVTVGLARKFEGSSTPPLVGVADLLRLERLQTQALRAVDAPVAPTRLQTAPNSAKSGVLLGPTAGRATTRVVPDPNLSYALQLSAYQQSDSMLQRPGTRVLLRRDSVVVVTTGMNTAEREKVQREVKKFTPRNVRVVSR